MQPSKRTHIIQACMFTNIYKYCLADRPVLEVQCIIDGFRFLFAILGVVFVCSFRLRLRFFFLFRAQLVCILKTHDIIICTYFLSLDSSSSLPIAMNNAQMTKKKNELSSTMALEANQNRHPFCLTCKKKISWIITLKLNYTIFKQGTPKKQKKEMKTIRLVRIINGHWFWMEDFWRRNDDYKVSTFFFYFWVSNWLVRSISDIQSGPAQYDLRLFSYTLCKCDELLIVSPWVRAIQRCDRLKYIASLYRLNNLLIPLDGDPCDSAATTTNGCVCMHNWLMNTEQNERANEPKQFQTIGST